MLSLIKILVHQISSDTSKKCQQLYPMKTSILKQTFKQTHLPKGRNECMKEKEREVLKCF